MSPAMDCMNQYIWMARMPAKMCFRDVCRTMSSMAECGMWVDVQMTTAHATVNAHISILHTYQHMQL